MVKKSVCQLIRLTKLKVPGSGGDNVVEFSRVLSSKDISNDSGSGQVSLPIDAQIPSLEGCATTVHWNILHIYYFVRLKVTMVDRKAIQVDLPVCDLLFDKVLNYSCGTRMKPRLQDFILL